MTHNYQKYIIKHNKKIQQKLLKTTTPERVRYQLRSKERLLNKVLKTSIVQQLPNKANDKLLKLYQNCANLINKYAKFLIVDVQQTRTSIGLIITYKTTNWLKDVSNIDIFVSMINKLIKNMKKDSVYLSHVIILSLLQDE